MNVVEASEATANPQASVVECDASVSLQCAALKNLNADEVSQAILLTAAALIAAAVVMYGAKAILGLLSWHSTHEPQERRDDDERDDERD